MHKRQQGSVSLGRFIEGAIKCVTRVGGKGAGVKEGFSEEVVFGLSPAHHGTFAIKASIAQIKMRL